MKGTTNPQKKDLLRRLVKKVLVHDKRTIEIWYALPNPRRFEDWGNWLPGLVSQSVVLWDQIGLEAVRGSKGHTSFRLLGQA